MPSRLWALLLLGILGCSTAERTVAPEKDAAVPPERGLSIAAYEGVFSEHPRLRRALEDLPGAMQEAERDVLARIGLGLDPDRPRWIVLTDEPEPLAVRSRIVGGRRVQEVPVPAWALAQGRIGAREAALDAIARAAIADLAGEDLPDWFVRGAPTWLSGEWEGALHERLLGLAEIPREAGSRIPPLRGANAVNDDVSSALFLRFLAVEFGAERLPDLGRALSAGGSVGDALRAAFGTDPASIPVAFDGFRLRVTAGILEDPYVRELAAARALPADRRPARLAGLEGRAADPWVAAAILEERALAEYESGAYEAAQDTLARVERDHVRHALALDRDRFLLALTFLGQGEPGAAALRLRTFLAEFPGSDFRVEASFRLGEILLSGGRAEEAMAEFRRVVESGAREPWIARAAVSLGAYETARNRFASARGWLAHAPESEEAARRLRELDDLERTGLPAGARGLVDSAVRDLGSGARAEAAAKVLAEVGPVCEERLLEGLGDAPHAWSGPYVSWSLSLAAAWRSPAGDRVLLRLLAAERPGVGPAALRELIARGVEPERLKAACPEGSESRLAWERRFGADGLGEDVIGMVASAEFETRVAGAERLAATPGPEAARRLSSMVADESPLVRAAVARALGRRPEADVREALFALSRDEGAGVRSAAFRACAERGEWSQVEAGFVEDPDPEVRSQCAEWLLDSGRSNAAGLVVSGLGDADPGLRVAVEGLLRETEAPGVGRALADALPQAVGLGHAMRIVRVIADRAGTDFGYDPAGSDAERRRVADAFRSQLERAERER